MTDRKVPPGGGILLMLPIGLAIWAIFVLLLVLWS